MRWLIVAVCMFSMPHLSLAELCSDVHGGGPCTPDPGEATTDAEKSIIELISGAKEMDPLVRKFEAQYRN